METKEKKMYMRIRNVCGLLGMLLPWIALFSAGIVNIHPNNEWWWSISATYYQTPALVAILTAASIVLMSYEGYDRLDNIITTLSGVFGLGVVLFPCAVSWMPADSFVGFFQIPMPISNTIHSLCAGVFFLLLAFNSAYLFTKTGGDMTPRKQLRNSIYRFCGWGMLCFEILFVVLSLIDAPGYCVMLLEIVLLQLFGISWLVKGEAFPFLNDN